MHYTCCSSNTNMRCIDAIVATRVNIVADGEACRLPNERAILRTDRRRLTWSTGLPLFHHLQLYPDDCLRLLSALQNRPRLEGGHAAVEERGCKPVWSTLRPIGHGWNGVHT